MVDIPWVFRLLNAVFQIRFGEDKFSVCNKFMRPKSFAYGISLMTHLNVFATPGSVTIRIGSMEAIRAGCPCGGVF